MLQSAYSTTLWTLLFGSTKANLIKTPARQELRTVDLHLYILFDVNLQLADRDSSKLDADLVLSSDLVHGALITYTEFWCPWGICSGNHGIGIGEVLIQE